MTKPQYPKLLDEGRHARLYPVYRCINCGREWVDHDSGLESDTISVFTVKSKGKFVDRQDTPRVVAEGHTENEYGSIKSPTREWAMFPEGLSHPHHFCNDGRVGLTQLVGFETDEETKGALKELQDKYNRVHIKEDPPLLKLAYEGETTDG